MSGGFYSGIAGARGKNPVGVVIHNDAGSKYATAAFYKGYLPSHNAANGFAHYYVAADGTYQAEIEKNKAWHTANSNGNANYIGIEACQSMGDVAVFKENELKSIKLAAEILKRYGLKPNRTTVVLHKQLSSTACPHRSVNLHGDGTVMQDYFIAQISKYMGSSSSNATNGTNSTNTTTQTKVEEDEEMFLFYKITGKDGSDAIYFFNGMNMTITSLNHPDEKHIYNEMYKWCNGGKEIPYKEFGAKDRWDLRIRAVCERSRQQNK